MSAFHRRKRWPRKPWSPNSESLGAQDAEVQSALRLHHQAVFVFEDRFFYGRSERVVRIAGR